MNPAGPTLLLGYEPRLDVFAGFSPSLMKNHLPEEVTIRKDLLELARDRGLAFGMKIGGKDVHPLETEGRRSPRNMVVAFAPDQFLHYAESVDEWTECSRDSKAFELMFRAVTIADIEKALGIGPLPTREKVAKQIYRYVRSSNFKRRVLEAYHHSCAVTGLQLELPEAAHICPVASGVDNDEVSNGIALSPTFHSAFDDGLIYFAYLHTGELKLRKSRYHGILKRWKRTAREELILSYVDETIPQEFKG